MEKKNNREQDNLNLELQGCMDRVQTLIQRDMVPRSNTKVDKELVHLKENERTDLLLAAKKDLLVSVSLHSHEMSTIKPNIEILNNNLDNFDNLVLQAVYALILEEYSYATPSMIYRKMIGADYTSTVNSDGEIIKKICVSMQKITFKRIEISWSKEASGAFPGLKNVTACGIKDFLLVYKEFYCDVNYGGKILKEQRYVFDYYKNGNLPPLLDYAMRLGQITFIPKQIMNDGIKSTPDVMVLRYKLLDFIAALKSPNFNDNSGFLTYATLFTNCGFNINPSPTDDTATRNIKKSSRHKKKILVERLLLHYKAKGYIDSFAEEKRNGQSGITIQCKKSGVSIEEGTTNETVEEHVETQDKNQIIKDYVKKELGLEFRIAKLSEDPSLEEVKELVEIVKKSSYLSNIKGYFDWIWTSRKDIKDGKYNDFSANGSNPQKSAQAKDEDYRIERERYYSELKRKAEQKAEYYQSKADKDPEYRELNSAYKALQIKTARAMFEQSSDKDELQNSLLDVKKKVQECLNRLGIKPETLIPQYSCTECQDTGFVVSSGKPCSCFLKRKQ